MYAGSYYYLAILNVSLILAYTCVHTLLDFTTAIQSGNETTRKSNYVSTSAENGPAMAGPAGPAPAPMWLTII